MSNTTTTSDEEFPSLLERHGWSVERAAWLDGHVDDFDADLHPRPGRVKRVDRGECDVITAGGVERVLSDSQRSQSEVAPATGDWVVVVDDPELGPVIGTIMPRHTAITRRDPGPVVAMQVLAANVDVVAVVHSLDQPFGAARLERFLVLAHDSGADPVVVLTKSDLGDASEVVAAIDELTDVPILVTSAVTGAGIAQLRSTVGGRTVVFIGLSGSGKSTLTNVLLGADVQPTTEVRESDARGRHTTTSRELFLLPGEGVLIDTPGVRAVGLWDAWTALHQVYGDVAEYAEQCRFGDCTHDHEPGCAVVAAIATGVLEADRVARYRQMAIELSELDDLIDENSRRHERGRQPRHPGRESTR